MQEEEYKPASPEQTRFEPGSTLLGKYRVIAPLAKGAQAIVILCDDMQMSRQVALKVLALNKSESSAERFKREARILAGLSHPNIVKIFTAGNLDDGSNFLAMEYMQGTTLEQLLTEKNTLSGEDIVSIFFQILQALEYLHSHGVLHRDIKPGNIMVRKVTADAEYEAKLLDFGIAKIFETEAVSGNETKSAGTLGTPNYMSPEQCQSKTLSPASDLYSLACVMYESASGKAPFAGSSPLDIMYKQTTESLPALTNVDQRISDLISKALEKDPTNRFSSAQKMLSELPKASDLDTMQMRTDPSVNSKGGSSKRTILLISILTIAFLVIGGTALWTSLKHKQADDNPVMLQHASGSKLLMDLRTKSPSDQYAISKKVLALGKHSDRESRMFAYFTLCTGAYLQEGADAEIQYAKNYVSEASNPRHPDLDNLNQAYICLADAYLHKQQLAQAEKVWQRLLDVLTNWNGSGDPKSKMASLYLARGKYFVSQGLYKQSMKELNLALKSLSTPDFGSLEDIDSRFCEAYFQMALVAIKNGKDAEAKTKIGKMSSMRIPPPDLPSKYIELAELCLQIRKFPELAQYTINKAMDTLPNVPPLKRQEAKVLLCRARYDFIFGKSKNKRKYYEQIVSMADEIDQQNKAIFYLSLGTTALDTRDFDYAEKGLKKTIETAGLKDPFETSGCMACYYLAALYLEQGKYALAEHYSDLALDYCRRVNTHEYYVFKQAIIHRIAINTAQKKTDQNAALKKELEARTKATFH